MSKVLIINTHPFTDKDLINFQNEILFVSTTGPYPENKPKYDMKSIISEKLFNHAVKNTISLKGQSRLGQARELIRILKHAKPDIIVSNIAEIFLSAIAFFYARLTGAKIFFYNEFWHFPKMLKMRIIERANNWFMRRSNGTYCIGTVHEKYLAGKGIRNILRIPPIYHRMTFDQNILGTKMKGKRFTITYIGRIVPYKGLDRLLRICQKIQQTHDIFLEIIGAQYSRDQYPGPDPDYEKKCREYADIHLKKNSFTFYGYQESTPYLQKSDLVVLPNRFMNDIVPCEAWGIICAEALIHQVPVIATTAVGSAYDLIQNGKNGYLVNESDDDAIEKAIEHIIIQKRAHTKSPRH